MLLDRSPVPYYSKPSQILRNKITNQSIKCNHYVRSELVNIFSEAKCPVVAIAARSNDKYCLNKLSNYKQCAYDVLRVLKLAADRQ